MVHSRQLLLNEIQSRLTTLLPSNPPIKEARILALKNVPAAAYEAVEDEVSQELKSDAGEFVEQIRSLAVNITVVARSATERDDLSLEIEKAMAPDFGIQSRLLGTSLEATGEGDRILYTAELAYEFSFGTREDAPDLTLSGGGIPTTFVSSLNALVGDVTIAGSGSVSVSQSGNTINVSSTGGTASTLQDAYNNGSGLIVTSAGKPVVVSGSGGLGVLTCSPTLVHLL